MANFVWQITVPETNSKFAPENGWLEDDPFLLGVSLFSGANLLLVSGRVFSVILFPAVHPRDWDKPHGS